MLILAQIPLPQTIIDILVIASVLLAIIGTLFLAYDLLGRENGLLRWFTLVIICGLISALIIGTITTIVRRILNNTIDLNSTLQFMSVGGLMGFYTVILIELPPSKSRPPIFSRKGTCIWDHVRVHHQGLQWRIGSSIVNWSAMRNHR
jgi:membrane-bound ClpP family serine protease